MPWRLVVIIAVLAVLLVFIGFNLDNKCDLSLGFTTFTGVPVYLTVFASFVMGMLASLPFIILGTLKKGLKKNKAVPDKASPAESTLAKEEDRTEPVRKEGSASRGGE